MIHIISKSIKPLSDLSVPTRGEFVILEKTPSHEQKNISSWDKGDHKEHLCIDFLSSKKGANELNPGHATMQNGSRVQSFSFILSPVCMPTCSKLTSCAVYCLLWLSSSLAAPNPFLCCSLLVACKDSVSAMLKELFTVLHGITVSPHQICCVQTLL